MDVNMWAQRVGTAQGWTKVNEEFLTITEPENKMDKSKMIVPKVRTHNESLPFYNADKSNVTNGRFLFPFGKVIKQENDHNFLMIYIQGLEYSPYQRSDQQQLPLYYIEPDPSQDDNEYKGSVTFCYATALLHLKHNNLNNGYEDAALRK